MGNLTRIVLLVVGLAMAGGVAHAQRAEQPQFGPVVQAYLGYLRNEQEVTDDRASRRRSGPDRTAVTPVARQEPDPAAAPEHPPRTPDARAAHRRRDRLGTAGQTDHAEQGGAVSD